MGVLGFRHVKAGVVFAALACAAAGLASADNKPVGFQPRWDREPPPTQAIFVAQKDLEGSVVLCCYPRANRTLACRVGHEAPRDYAFGYHAMQLAYYYRLSRESFVDYESGAHAPIELRYTFDVDAPGRGFLRTREQARGQTIAGAEVSYACPVARINVDDRGAPVRR